MSSELLPKCELCDTEAEMGGTGLSCRCGNAACEMHTTIRVEVWKSFMRHAHELRQENERLREALRFYANKTAYVYGNLSAVYNDAGAIARKALGGGKDEKIRT